MAKKGSKKKGGKKASAPTPARGEIEKIVAEQMAAKLQTGSEVERLLNAISARLAKGKEVRLTHIGEAVKGRFNIDLTARLARLEQPIMQSVKIYQRAREKLVRESAGKFNNILAIVPAAPYNVFQESDDFEVVYRQAREAQEVLKRKLATAWLPDPVPCCEVAQPGKTSEWVDSAVSPGVMGRPRALEKCKLDYAGHAKCLKDLARVSLVFKAFERMTQAAATEMNGAGMRPGMIKNTYVYPTALGCCDVKVVVELPLSSGTKYFAEVELNHQDMLDAKKEAQPHYETIRRMLPDVCAGIDDVDSAELERFIVSHLEEACSMDFAREALAEKAASPSDVVYLARQIDTMAQRNGLDRIDLTALYDLPLAPDKQQLQPYRPPPQPPRDYRLPPHVLQAAANGDRGTVHAWLTNKSTWGHPNALTDGSHPQRQTMLMAASASGRLHAVRVLLAQGADPNLQNADGDTALLLATQRRMLTLRPGSDECVRCLLSHGADPAIMNRHGESARTFINPRFMAQVQHGASSLHFAQALSERHSQTTPNLFGSQTTEVIFDKWERQSLQLYRVPYSAMLPYTTRPRSAMLPGLPSIR